MIASYQQEIEEDFGLIRFEIGKTTTDKRGRGRPSKYALLTEDQTYAYLAYSQNTEQARARKRKLVKAFSVAREAILTLQVTSQANLTNLTARQIRMIGLAARMIDLDQKGKPCEHLMELFVAECESMTLTERLWGETRPKQIPQSYPPIF